MTDTLTAPAAPTTGPTRWTVDPIHSSIHFSGRQMMISTVRGRFARFVSDVFGSDAKPEDSRVDILVDAASLDTGFDNRY